MFDNQPTNPQIVAQILSLSDGWRELLGPEDAAKPARKTRRAPAKRAVKAKS